MAMQFDGRLLEPTNEKPLTMSELQMLKESWKHHAVISALIDSAIKRRLPKQITPV